MENQVHFIEKIQIWTIMKENRYSVLLPSLNLTRSILLMLKKKVISKSELLAILL